MDDEAILEENEEEKEEDDAMQDLQDLQELKELGLEVEDEEMEQEEVEEDEPPPPPPPEEEKELLFLIEFLVDTLTIKLENMKIDDIDPCALQGPSVVALTFLHFPPMLIGEKDVDTERRTGSTEVAFNSGKSLMFALTENQFEDPPPIYLSVSAVKQMPHAFRIPQVLIGKTKIMLTELFMQVFDKYDENPQKTVSKSVKDKYELIGEKNKPAGEISIYIRLTCIGENIVTEFQKGEDINDPLLYKNVDSKKVYECFETRAVDDEQAILVPGYGAKSNVKPCISDEYVTPRQQPSPEDEKYEEIYAEINGSVLIINVEKNKRKDPPKKFHVSEFCDCNIPLPEKLVAGMSDLSLSPASMGSINLVSGTPVKTDKFVGLDSANQLMFKVPPPEVLAQPGLQNNITYNVNSCVESESHGHKVGTGYRVTTASNVDGPFPKMPNDPEKDVFILRIIKRGRKELGKDALELEFKMPKEKIEPPKRPPYMVEKAVGSDKKNKKDKNKKKRK